VDPAVAYYTVDFEPILNVYQSLIAYNGSADGPTPASYVPQLATCVPGSNECTNQFGNTLVYNNATTGAPQYYTFEIDSTARFYDPSTGAGFPVYPSDVMFSFARTMGWSDLPGVAVNNGWINTQDLVPNGNSGWDSATHYPYNNTPQHILGAFLVNDSNYCPSSAVVTTNGCITFNVGPSGQAWPYFLELVADDLGGAIVSCGVFTHLGAGVPGFAASGAPNGDGPCLLPGGSTATSQAGFQNYLTTTAPNAWDAFEQLGRNTPAVQPSVQYNETGSGPYYLQNPEDPAVGYTLHANPDYNAPVGCAGQPGCQPIKGHYQANAVIVWQQTGDTTGLNEMTAGVADTAAFSAAHTGLVLNIVSTGSYYLLTGLPTLTIGFNQIDLNFSVANEATIDSTGNLNIPSTFFQNNALRQFLVNAYPYKTIDSTFNTVDGIQFGQGYGGAIPHYMGPYYPTNVSFPSGDPTSSPGTPGNVTWWWHEAITPGTPWYNATIAACTSGSPCKWADISFIGAPTEDAITDTYNAEIASLTGNALQPYRIDIAPGTWIGQLSSPPGTSALTIMMGAGWAPDYPDPTDYAAPLYYPDNSYTYSDAVLESLTQTPGLNQTTAGCPTSVSLWTTLTTYANMAQLPNTCQGPAYQTMEYWQNAASHLSDVSLRILEYNLVEHIANTLALYVYDPQSVGAVDYGNWIQSSTINFNPTIGGGGDQLWYDWGYQSDYFNVSLTETGLPVGTFWSSTLAGVPGNSTSATIEYAGLTNGSLPFTIGPVAGYQATPGSGTVTVSGADSTTPISWTQVINPGTLAVGESGLPAKTNWTFTATLTGTTTSVTPPLSNGTLISVPLSAGAYTVTPGSVVGYTATPASVPITVTSGTPAYANFTYAVVVHNNYSVVFTASGLAGGTWGVSINGVKQTGTGSLTFQVPDGTYTWAITTLPTGDTASPLGGVITVNGAAVPVSVTVTSPGGNGGGGGGSTSGSPAWNSLSTLAYVLIGVLAVLVVIFLALAAMYAGRKPPSAPESWSGGSSSTTTTETTGENKSGGM